MGGKLGHSSVSQLVDLVKELQNELVHHSTVRYLGYHPVHTGCALAGQVLVTLYVTDSGRCNNAVRRWYSIHGEWLT